MTMNMQSSDIQSYDLENRLDNLLHELTQKNSRVSSAAYDTAWAARLVPHYPEHGFQSALEWLRANQHDDGSWGESVFHAHNRVVSTLAAMIALSETGNAADRVRVQAGETFLWRNTIRLGHDMSDTIGFPLIAAFLVQEAQRHGLDIPPGLARNSDIIKRKLNLLPQNPQKWVDTPLHHSLEALMHHLPDTGTFDFADRTGCVGSSPAATAATLQHDSTRTARSLTYLTDLMAHQGDGGLPNVDRIDVFEAAWSLHSLLKDDLVQPEHPAIQVLLETLWQAWSDDTGASFSSTFKATDLDDTAMAFLVLRWGGYPVNPAVFERYEEDGHFVCFPGEADPSLSVHLRMLAALQYAPDVPQYARWSEKIIAFLRQFDVAGDIWFDKWHISPYYLTGPAVWLLHDLVDDLVYPRLRWIVKTQRPDGGWGFYETSTLEETAYSLQALLYADQHIQTIDPAVIQAGAAYFLAHLPDATHPPLWIGKGLYTPYRVIEATIIATLHSLQAYLN